MKIMSVLVAMLSLTASLWALDSAEWNKKLKELNDEDPKVRASAIADVGPVFVQLMAAMQRLRRDPNPDVVAAMRKVDARIMEDLLHTPKSERTQLAEQETAAARACRAFAEAEEIYHRTDYNRDGVLEYAQHLKGQYSLLENKAGTGDLGLVDKAFADAEGAPGKAVPKAGYCFKVLTRQGPATASGSRDYIRDGHMTLGYAIVAYPAEYGKTGRKCFMLNNAGTIFEKDLGNDTPAIIEKMNEFNPDGWQVTE